MTELGMPDAGCMNSRCLGLASSLVPLALKLARGTCMDLTALPNCSLSKIISRADPASRLSLFRSNTILRDAVLGHVAVGGEQPLRTVLYFGLPRGQEACESAAPQAQSNLAVTSVDAARHILQRAAGSAHDTHVCVGGFMLCLDKACHLMRSTPRDTDVLIHMCSRCNNHFTRSSVQDWLLQTLQAWLVHPCSMPSLRHVTHLKLQDMLLDHPMPACIGLVCCALESFELQNVVWPYCTVTHCWPQVRRLTIREICDVQLPDVFNPNTLPKLTSMHIAWTPDSSTPRVPRRPLARCFCGFYKQLEQLQFTGFSWTQAMWWDHDVVFPALKWFSASIHAPKLQYDSLFAFMVRSMPNIESLRFEKFGMCNCRMSHVDLHGFEWSRLQRVQVDSFEGEPLRVLACLPPMPAFRFLSIPSGTTSTEVAVGPNWLDDVAKALRCEAV